MNKKQALVYAAALAVCFLLGCGVSLILGALDARDESIAPIAGGQTIDFTEYGFTLTVPSEYILSDYTTNNHAEGGDALFAGCAYASGSELYIYCYANDAGDSVSDYGQQELVTYYTSAGADEVRLRELGGRRFVCYEALVETAEGAQRWYLYETWDSLHQLTFETQIPPEGALPILKTLSFPGDAPGSQTDA
ncbi:MAG: hypothetical protein Q4G52_08910 [Clostridia bacterium]|nr:hypothetical protein [Clostridia bacterium]